MKSTSSIAILGAFTVLILTVVMLFALESSPDLRKKMEIAEEIKFDQDVDYVSILDNGELYKVVIIADADNGENLKERAEEIGKYIWRKYSYQEQFTELEIVYQVNIGSGCHQNSVNIECNIPNPMQKIK